MLLQLIIICSYLYSHPHLAWNASAQSELEEVKQLYQAQIIEKEKPKQKLEETDTSLVKVC